MLEIVTGEGVSIKYIKGVLINRDSMCGVHNRVWDTTSCCVGRRKWWAMTKQRRKKGQTFVILKPKHITLSYLIFMH